MKEIFYKKVFRAEQGFVSNWEWEEKEWFRASQFIFAILAVGFLLYVIKINGITLR